MQNRTNKDNDDGVDSNLSIFGCGIVINNIHFSMAQSEMNRASTLDSIRFDVVSLFNYINVYLVGREAIILYKRDTHSLNNRIKMASFIALKHTHTHPKHSVAEKSIARHAKPH